MLSSITAAVAVGGVNIENLINKSRQDFAYTMLDLSECDSAAIEAALLQVEGVIKVRII